MLRFLIDAGRCLNSACERGAWLLCLGFLLLFSSPPPSVAQAAHEKPRPIAVPRLEKIKNIRSLSPEDARRQLPVRLEGVVTVLSGWKNSFFVQDATAGISVDRLDSVPELSPGDKVIVNGTTGTGAFAPIVISQNVQLLGKARPPDAKIYRPAELFGGAEDSQWIAVRGDVRSATIRSVWNRTVLIMDVDIGSGMKVEAHVHDFDPNAVDQLVGATVKLRGVCGTIFNDRRQFVGLRLFMASLGDAVIEKSPPADLFNVPGRALGDLLQFSDSTKIIDHVKVQGIVTWSRSGTGFYLQQGTDAAFIESSEPEQVHVGDEVEVSGYPSNSRGAPSLHASAIRVLSNTRPLRPLPGRSADMIVLHEGFVSTPYDSRLVSLQGRLIEEVPGALASVLVLRDGTSVFNAILPNSKHAKRPEPGSLVAVTGICSVSLDGTYETSSFQIFMRSESDLVVVKRAPWWNATHAMQLSVGITLTILGFLAWSIPRKRRAHLEALAFNDSLTSLYNRRGFTLLAQRQWDLATRRHEDMLLFYLDVNRFKEINDTLGHAQGDRALQQVAEALAKTFRKSDILGRLGGDEFAAVSINASSESKDMILERLREEIARINLDPPHNVRITASIGVVVCDHRETKQTLADHMERADSLMYAQKLGRMADANSDPPPSRIQQRNQPAQTNA